MKGPLNHIRFMGRDISFEYRPLRKANGEWHYDKNLVKVKRKLDPIEEQDVVFHELTHAVSDLMNLELTENQVRLLATAWISLLHDNQHLYDYLKHQKKEGAEAPPVVNSDD